MAFQTYPRNGFTLITRNASEDYVRNYKATASTNQPIALGDTVCEVNGIIVPATAGQDPAQAPIGVVVGIYTSANRPYTLYTTKLIASGADGRVDVNYDPNAEYVVRCETSVGPSNLNHNVILVASGANATTGRSQQSVDIPASASINDLFRVVRIAPYNDIVGVNGFNELGGAGNGVVVRWNRHTFKAGTVGQ